MLKNALEYREVLKLRRLQQIEQEVLLIKKNIDIIIVVHQKDPRRFHVR